MQHKHHDTWNTVKDLCVFVSNQSVLTIKDLRATVESFLIVTTIQIKMPPLYTDGAVLIFVLIYDFSRLPNLDH